MTGETHETDRLLGAILAGRYRIVQKLGEGAMGAVYLGEHLKIGRRDAIKVLRTALARDTEAIARFTRGARNVSAVRHPNVCAIYDFGDTEDGLPFLAMEYIAGESLKDTLDRETRLPLKRALDVARQVASALDAAHDVGIIHRDLKPGNIMLLRGRDGRDQVKVVDFDIAKGPETGGEEVTRLGFVVGTPEYMSPEQLMAEPLDGRSDLYSLGLILFRMLTGTLPFRATTTQDLMIERLTTPPLMLEEALPGIAFPERLRGLLERTLQRRAADRVVSAEAFEREVVAMLGSPVVVAAASAPSSSAPRTPRRAATHGELAATRIATSPAPAVEQNRTHEERRDQWRRNLKIGAAVTVLVIASVTVASVVMNGSGGSVEPLPAADRSGEADAASGPGSTSTEALLPADSTPDTGDRAITSAAAEDPPPLPQPTTGTETRGATGIPAERANDLLFQQLDLLTAQGSRRTTTAVIDTASMIWRDRSLSQRDRALAAYVLASAFDARSEYRLCSSWLDSALVLNPTGPGFATLHEKCRRLSR